MDSANEEIILNKMYVGEYISEKSDNIGHEIINLYRDDAGDNYIYVLEYGVVAKSHNDKINTILLVRKIEDSLWLYQEQKINRSIIYG